MNMAPRSYALMGQVVDGIDGGAPVPGLRPLHGVDVDGHERRLPVVRMDHVGYPAERFRQLEGAPRQEREALEVVRIGVWRRTVEVRTIEISVMLETVDGHLATGQPPESNARVRHPEPHGYRQHAVQALELVPRHAGIERHDDPHIAPQLVERLREGADHLPEAAGLRPRRTFRRDVEPFERRRRGAELAAGRTRGHEA